MRQRRSFVAILHVVVLLAWTAGCDNVAAPQRGWGIGDIPADIPFERTKRPVEDADEVALGEPNEVRDDEDRDHEQVRGRNRRLHRSDGVFQNDDPLPSESGDWGENREMPSQTERWGRDREMPSDSMPSRTERWGDDREMPSDDMPSRTFPSFRRDPLPNESYEPMESESPDSTEE